MNQKDLQNVIKTLPNLTNFGIGTFRGSGMTVAERDANFRRDQEALLLSAPICTKICAWLADKPRVKNINPRHTSYGYKHWVEKDIGEYVANGQFIAAAIHCGLKYKIDDVNVQFNLSEKPFKRREGECGVWPKP